MEQSKEFVSEIKKPEEERKKTPEDYILEEMQDDISVFSEYAQRVIQRLAIGEKIDNRVYSFYLQKERDAWWQNKYGFPFEIKAARNELIMRKYAKPEDKTKAKALQEQLLEAFSENNSEEIENIKKLYETEYPDQLEGVECLFGLSGYFQDQKDIDVYKKTQGRHYSEEVSEKFKSLTEYSFLISDFISRNSGDKNFLEKFWKVAEEISKKTDNLKTFHALQHSIATQVATLKVFEKLGVKPNLSHPAEDAFRAIDIWAGSETAVQIKGGYRSRPEFIKTDAISFPGVEFSKEDSANAAAAYHIDSYTLRMSQQFQAKIKQYGKFTGKTYKGYFVVIPYQKIDFVTGEPSEDLVEFFKKSLEKETAGESGQ